MNSRVWVVQEGNNDYASAEEFGEVRFITHADLRAMPDSKQNRHVEADIRKFKAEYLPGTDYIIPTGNPMVVALATLSLATVPHKFLKWDGRRQAYIPFTLNPKEITTGSPYPTDADIRRIRGY